MKIIQIATLISPDGAYGGPVRVAVNQTRALLDAGHQVTLAAGATGFGRRLPKTYDGVPVTLFPAFRPAAGSGFAGLIAPGLQSWLKTAITGADIAHIHLGRDLITLPAARQCIRRKLPYVAQTHGMIAPSANFLAPLVDAVWTTRALEEAGKVFYLTEAERSGLIRLNCASLKLQNLHNGVPEPKPREHLSFEDEIEVLFLARLHARKRPQAFLRMARLLHAKHPAVKFVIVGPDEGEGAIISKLIRSERMEEYMTWEGALAPEATALRMARASIYVLPSVHEPFPMSVLEAMSLGKPVVVTDSCGLAGPISRHQAGAVVDDTVESLASAVDRLLSDPLQRQSAGRQARELSTTEFSMASVGATLERTYRELHVDDPSKIA